MADHFVSEEVPELRDEQVIAEVRAPGVRPLELEPVRGDVQAERRHGAGDRGLGAGAERRDHLWVGAVVGLEVPLSGAVVETGREAEVIDPGDESRGGAGRPASVVDVGQVEKVVGVLQLAVPTGLVLTGVVDAVRRDEQLSMATTWPSLKRAT